MKINEMVCDLQHSKALVDAGIVVDSYFWWIDSVVSSQYEIASNPLFKPVGSIPAPLPCELMKVMPNGTEVGRCSDGYLAGIPMENYESWASDTPANALADMAIWLKGEGLLEPKEGE